MPLVLYNTLGYTTNNNILYNILRCGCTFSHSDIPGKKTFLSFAPYLREESITTSCQNRLEFDSRKHHWQDIHVGNAISDFSNE